MVLLNVAGLAATAPPLGLLLLWASVLGDTAALYSLSKAPAGSVPGGPSTFAQLRVKAEIVRAVRSEMSAFASNTSAVKEKITAAVKAELAAFNVKPSDANRLTGFTNAWTTGLQKGQSLTDAIKMLRKDPGVALIEDKSGEPFLLQFIKAVIEAVKTKQLDLTLGERVWDTVNRQSTERVKERATERSDIQKNALVEANKRREQYPEAKAAAAAKAAEVATAEKSAAASAVTSTAAAAAEAKAARARKTLTTPPRASINARADALAARTGAPRMAVNPLAVRRGGASKSQVTEFLRLALEKDQPPGAVEDAFGLVATVDPADELLGKRLMPVFDEFLLFRGKAEDTGLKNTKYSETQLGSALNMFDRLLPDYFDAINPAFKDIVNDPSIASILNAELRMSPELGLTPTRQARFLWGQALMKVLKQREGDAAAKAKDAAASADKAAAQAEFVKQADAEVKLESPLTSAVPGAKSTLDNVKGGETKRLQKELKNAKDGLLNFQRAVDDATARIDTIEGTKGMKLPSQDELAAAQAKLAAAQRRSGNPKARKLIVAETEEQIRKLEASAAASQAELEAMLVDAKTAKDMRVADLEAVKKKIADLEKSLTAMGAPLTDATDASPPPPLPPPPPEAPPGPHLLAEAIASLAQRNAAIAAGWKTDKDDADAEYWYHDDVPGSQWDVPSAEDIKKSTAATAAKADEAEAAAKADAARISELEANLEAAKAAAAAAVAANAGRERETAEQAKARNAAAAEAEALGRAAAAARNEEALRLAREKEAAVKRADAADAAAAAARVNGEKAAAAQAAQAAAAAARAAADLAAQKAAVAAAGAQAANLRQQLEDAKRAQADAAAGNAAAAQAAQAAQAAAAAENARLKSEVAAAKAEAAKAAAAAEAAKAKAAEAPPETPDAVAEAAAGVAALSIAAPSQPSSAPPSAPVTPGAAEVKAELDDHPEWKEWKPTMTLSETEKLATKGNTRARYALYNHNPTKYPTYLLEAAPYPPATIKVNEDQIKRNPAEESNRRPVIDRAKLIWAAMPEADKVIVPNNAWRGGRRRKHTTPKKRKARKSTFRRHRKH